MSLGAAFASDASGPSLAYVLGLPNPSTLSSPQLVVIFKNLLKRDQTTRDKALVEFVALLSDPSSSVDIDDATHWAWVLMYPKLAIDTSRNVRALAHRAQGHVCKLLGKQASRYLKESIGPWLMGLHDSDKLVTQAAEQALELVFPDPKKRDSLYTLFSEPLLQFVLDAVAHETTTSLSDERFVTADEAETKYYRTVRAGLATLSVMIKRNSSTDKVDNEHLYLDVFASKPWKFASTSADPTLAKTALELISTLVNKRPEWAETYLSEIATALFIKALDSAQSVMLTEVLQTCIVLTRKFPQAWELAKSKKSPAVQHLLRFIRNGSQRSGKYYWPSILALLSSLPDSISPYSNKSPAGTSEAFTEALQEAITKEMVVQLVTGWGTYLSVVEKIVASEASPKVRETVLKSALDHITNTFILVEGDILDRDILVVLGRKSADLWELEPEISHAHFNRIILEIVQDRRSKTLLKKYLFTAKVLFDHLKTDSHKQVLLQTLTNPIKDALKGLNLAATGDEFNLHAMASVLVAFDESVFKADRSLLADMEVFIQERLADAIVSDVAADAVQILRLYATYNTSPEADKTIQTGVKVAFNSVVKLSNLDRRSSLFPLILREYAIFRGRTTPIPLASEYLLSVYSSIDSWEITNDWDSILFGISSHGIFVSEDVAFDILNGVSSFQLIKRKNVEKAIWTFSSLLKLDRAYFMKFIETDSGKQLVSSLWKLSEDHPEAEGILNVIEDNAILPKDEDSNVPFTKTNKTLDSLADGLTSEVERSSLDSVELSVQRGQRLLDQTLDSSMKHWLFEKLLFYTSGSWKLKLTLLFENEVASSLVVSNPLGSALVILKSLNEESKKLQIVPDELLTMSMFAVTLIMNNLELFDTLPFVAQVEVCGSLCLISEASTDHAFLAISDFDSDDNFINDAIHAFNKDVSSVLMHTFEGFSLDELISSINSSVVETDDYEQIQAKLGYWMTSAFWGNSMTEDARGYYSARVLRFIIYNLVERDNPSAAEADELFVKFHKVSFNKSNLGSAAVIAGFQKFSLQLKSFDRLRNQFSSELISVRGEKVLPDKLLSLIFLNMLLDSPDEELLEKGQQLIPVPRLIKCFQSLNSAVHSEYSYTPEFMPAQVEVTKLFSKLIPLYVDAIDGTMWESFVELLGHNFASLDSDSVSLEYFTLKYFNILERLRSSTPALDSVWLDREAIIYTELQELLFRAKASVSWARELSNVQLLRAVTTTPLKLVEEPEKLYTILAVPSPEIQRAGFNILHQLIPAEQENRSIELKLKSGAKVSESPELEEEASSNALDPDFTLPPELLSLLVETPVRGAPAHETTRYLWAWMLVYDHFTNAIYDLRKIYVTQLKDGGHLEVFLNFISGQIVFEQPQDVYQSMNPEQVIKGYGNNEELMYGSMAEEIDVVLVRLYFLALQNTGSFVKSWFLNIKKRQVSLGLQKFTETYMTPIIIGDELDSIEETLKKADSTLIDEHMSIKVFRPLSEVRAYYTIDDQKMEIAVRFPALYPLKDIQVEGIRRVGVRERLWRAWILASQAIGTTQNGSIIDVLELFKRNVSLHFEGMDECAICYSILHQDHSLPTKSCTTCHNKFHANCLYRWFKSSSTSTCPLCRSSFSFRVGM